MDEGRKKLIYLVAGMFLVRRLAGMDRRPSFARENAFRGAIDNAVELMWRLDARFPNAAKPRQPRFWRTEGRRHACKFSPYDSIARRGSGSEYEKLSWLGSFVPSFGR
jgi:hypothetical protein